MTRVFSASVWLLLASRRLILGAYVIAVSWFGLNGSLYRAPGTAESEVGGLSLNLFVTATRRGFASS